ncbi:MAG TPA: hypothetical protein VHO07_28810 [Streptosporangiaceae bacterium]|nr:hypothetical protein [Streptosporangiaceae bacterium]
MPFTGSREQQATETVRPAAPSAQPAAPSWGPVLATTVKLWSARGLHRLRHSRQAWLVAICVLAVAAVAVVVVVQAAGTSARAPASARAGHSQPSRSGAARSSAAARIRSQAAAWMAGQVSQAETIACDPSMCAALRAHGVASSRLLSLSPSASGGPGADVIVASPATHPWLSQAAPALLASVGSGVSLIEVRAVSPGGTASYQAALRADLADRQSAGAQLMHSRRIEVSAQGAGQLADSEVDSRLLIMLAVLASQHPWRVIAFGDPSPGVPASEAPYRQVTIAAADGGSGTAILAAAIALLRAQQAPYLPAQVTTVRLAGGQQGLRIDFAAPDPLGLLAGSVTG